MGTKNFWSSVALLLTLILSACEKKSVSRISDTPVFVSMSPAQGKAGTVVTILGRNFSSNPNDNVVLFSGKQAALLSVEKGKLIVAVPADGITGEVELQISGVRLEGGRFTYLEPTKEYIVGTLAGTGMKGFTDGDGETASFLSPEGIAAGIHGELILSDRGNQAIRSISLSGMTTTITGFNGPGFINGPLGSASFKNPWKCDVDAEGNIYVADRDNHAIRKISAGGQVSTVAGGAMGYQDGAAADAKFNQPIDLCVDNAGNIYVADNNNHRIRKITPGGIVSTLAGSVSGFADGKGETAQFKNPSGIDVDQEGNLYVADRLNNRIRKITPEGMVSTIAGAATVGRDDGPGEQARFNQPYGIAVGAAGALLVADLSNNIIRMITPDGVVSTIAGTSAGFQDGLSSTAKFSSPTDLVLGSDGAIYVTDLANNRIRRIIEIAQ